MTFLDQKHGLTPLKKGPNVKKEEFGIFGQKHLTALTNNVIFFTLKNSLVHSH